MRQDVPVLWTMGENHLRIHIAPILERAIVVGMTGDQVVDADEANPSRSKIEICRFIDEQATIVSGVLSGISCEIETRPVTPSCP